MPSKISIRLATKEQLTASTPNVDLLNRSTITAQTLKDFVGDSLFGSYLSLNSIPGTRIKNKEITKNQIADETITGNVANSGTSPVKGKIALGTITPANLSQGAPSWDSVGGLNVSQSITAGGDINVTGNVVAENLLGTSLYVVDEIFITPEKNIDTRIEVGEGRTNGSLAASTNTYIDLISDWNQADYGLRVAKFKGVDNEGGIYKRGNGTLTISNEGIGAMSLKTSNIERISISSTGTIDVKSNLISNVKDPVSAQDAATKKYIDNKSGSILQVGTAISGPTLQTITSVNPVAVNDLSVTITPKLANSKIIISGYITCSKGYVMSFGVFKNGVATVNTTGFTNSNHPNMQITTFEVNDNNQLIQVPFMHVETSGDTNSRTYQIYATSGWGGVAYSMHINNRAANDMASFSAMTVYEVAP